MLFLDESYPTEVYSNRGSFLSEIEEAVNKIKEFKGKYSWTEKNEQLKGKTKRLLYIYKTYKI